MIFTMEDFNVTREKRAQAGLIAVLVVVIIIVGVVVYYYVNSSHFEATIIKCHMTFEDSQYVYKIFAEVTNNGGDGSTKVFAEKKQYDRAETLEYSIYLKNGETKILEFTFGLDPYVKLRPSGPIPAPSTNPDPYAAVPEPPPIYPRVWAEPE
jgi:hypothetical protein